MSEIARLMKQIQAEYEAGQRALHAPRIAAPHLIATYHTERMALYLEQLRQVAGEEAARDALIQWGGKPQ